MTLLQGPGHMGFSPSPPLPQRPGEKECTFFLRTGRCQYGMRCRFHHPMEKLAAITGGPAHPHAHAMHPHAGVHGHGHGMAPGFPVPGQHPMPMDPAAAAAAYGGYGGGAQGPMRGGGVGGDPSLPSRPGTEACGYFMRTGKCSYGMSCRFDHPRSGYVFACLPACVPACLP